ncbi:MAG: carboxypeptidase-like regulatory domain-containing protein, partial [Vicinamibacterales bacterium]
MWRLVPILMGALAAAVPALAQETLNYASISGRVTDPQGAAVEGATVTTRHLETGVTASATSDV